MCLPAEKKQGVWILSGHGRYIQLFMKVVLVLVLLVCWLWGGAALFLAGPEPHWLRVVLVCVFGAFLPGCLIFVRLFHRAFFLSCCVIIPLLFWWQTLVPSNDKNWAADVAQISNGSILGDDLVMHNVRNFIYVDENTPVERWVTRSYDLDKLQGLDLFISYWASEHIAHTILSWDFGEDGHLAISIETRKDTTQEYSAVKGFFKQFTLSYVAADETDIIKLRTNYRKERVYLYQLLATKKDARALLETYLDEMNLLVNEPKFYNALTRNCTTTIRIHGNAARTDAPPPFDWRIIMSGHVDELLYDRKAIDQSIPFVTLRESSRVDLEMQKYKGSEFSKAMREIKNQSK